MDRRVLLSTIGIILSFALLRIIVAPWFGLSVDEAHYVLYGLNPDWSYFDHPPLVGWTHWLFLHLFGKSELWARLPAIIISAITSILCVRFLRTYTNNTNYILWAVVALNASLGFAGLSLMLLPDSILFTLTFLFITAVNRVRLTGSITDWLLLGLITGISGLAKYSAILLPIALIITIIDTGNWKYFFTWKLGIAISVALVVISPVLFWNLTHNLASFQYQQGRVLRTSGWERQNVLISYATQFLVFGPFLAPIAGYGIWCLIKRRDFISRLVLWICVVFFVFFSFAGLGKPTLPHWWGVLYVLAIPIGTVFLLKNRVNWWPKFTKIAVISNLSLAVLLHLELAYPFLPMPDYQSIHRDILGWPSIMAKAEIILEKNRNHQAIIAVPNWSLGSRAIYYAHDPSKVLVVDDRFDQFDLWQTINPLGRDLLLLLPQDFHIDPDASYRCTTTETAGEIEITLPTHKVNQVKFTWCRGFAGLR